MNKYAIIGIILISLGMIVGLAFIAQPKTGPSNEGQSSVLSSDMPMFDFGQISMAKGKVEHVFKITNPSSQVVKINKIFTSCMCTQAQFELNGKVYGPFDMEGMGGDTATDVTLEPNASANLTAIYDPAAHGPAGVGMIDRYVVLQGTDGSQLKIEIKADVTP